MKHLIKLCLLCLFVAVPFTTGLAAAQGFNLPPLVPVVNTASAQSHVTPLAVDPLHTSALTPAPADIARLLLPTGFLALPGAVHTSAVPVGRGQSSVLIVSAPDALLRAITPESVPPGWALKLDREQPDLLLLSVTVPFSALGAEYACVRLAPRVRVCYFPTENTTPDPLVLTLDLSAGNTAP